VERRTVFGGRAATSFTNRTLTSLVFISFSGGQQVCDTNLAKTFHKHSSERSDKKLATRKRCNEVEIVRSNRQPAEDEGKAFVHISDAWCWARKKMEERWRSNRVGKRRASRKEGASRGKVLKVFSSDADGASGCEAKRCLIS
jgi:hypothetical protein